MPRSYADQIIDEWEPPASNFLEARTQPGGEAPEPTSPAAADWYPYKWGALSEIDPFGLIRRYGDPAGMATFGGLPGLPRPPGETWGERFGAAQRAIEQSREAYYATPQGRMQGAPVAELSNILGSISLLGAGTKAMGALAGYLPSALRPAASFLGGTAPAGAGVGTRLAAMGTAGALQASGLDVAQSELSGQGFPSPRELGVSTLLGFGLNPIFGGAGMSPADAATVQKARAGGVNLKSGQLPSGPMLTGAYAGTEPSQMEAWHRWAFREATGQDVASMEKGDFNKLLSDTQADREAIAKGKTISYPQQEFARIWNDAYTGLAGSPSSLKGVQDLLSNVAQAYRTGIAMGGKGLTGEAYMGIVKRGGDLDQAIHGSDTNVAGYAMQMRKALDDSFTSSLMPGDAAKYLQATDRYRLMKDIEPALKAKSAPPGGLDPNVLYNTVKNRYGTRPGVLPDIAEVGQVLQRNLGKADLFRELRNRPYDVIPKTVGGLGMGALGWEYAPPLAHSPWLVGPVAAAGAGLAAGGVMSRPWMTNLLARGVRPGRLAIPLATSGANLLYGGTQ